MSTQHVKTVYKIFFNWFKNNITCCASIILLLKNWDQVKLVVQFLETRKATNVLVLFWLPELLVLTLDIFTLQSWFFLDYMVWILILHIFPFNWISRCILVVLYLLFKIASLYFICLIDIMLYLLKYSKKILLKV